MKEMNLYIIESVLWDWTSGMVCIAADSLEQCRKLFIDEFVGEFVEETPQELKHYDKAIKENDYKVLKVIHDKPEIVSYVHGGS